MNLVLIALFFFQIILTLSIPPVLCLFLFQLFFFPVDFLIALFHLLLLFTLNCLNLSNCPLFYAVSMWDAITVCPLPRWKVVCLRLFAFLDMTDYSNSHYLRLLKPVLEHLLRDIQGVSTHQSPPVQRFTTEYTGFQSLPPSFILVGWLSSRALHIHNSYAQSLYSLLRLEE